MKKSPLTFVSCAIGLILWGLMCYPQLSLAQDRGAMGLVYSPEDENVYDMVDEEVNPPADEESLSISVPDFGWCVNGHDVHHQCRRHGGECSEFPDTWGQTHCMCGDQRLPHKKCCVDGQIVACGQGQVN